MATGRSRSWVESGLESLMAEEIVQVSVAGSAVLVYRLQGHDEARVPSDHRLSRRMAGVQKGWTERLRLVWERRDETPAFDRKTLQLIRGRQGVISLAELVEHTGLTVPEAESEIRRLAGLYGGEPHTSWDGHVVYAFPDLVESAHGAFHVREPRPAWARSLDPMGGRDTRKGWRRWIPRGVAAVAASALAWLATFPPPGDGRAAVLAAVAGTSAAAAFVITGKAVRRFSTLPFVRQRSAKTLRRYALGYVFETALRGKGVVSLDRTVAYLRSRAGGRRIRRKTVETALRQLALEFEAPVIELNGDLFFGFRNVKRQFLASQVQRIRLDLERKDDGRTIFDSGDARIAAERELEDFDRALLEPPLPPGFPSAPRA